VTIVPQREATPLRAEISPNDSPTTFSQMLKKLEIMIDSSICLSLVMVTFWNLLYYFWHASMLVFGKAISFSRLHMGGFSKGYNQK